MFRTRIAVYRYSRHASLRRGQNVLEGSPVPSKPDLSGLSTIAYVSNARVREFYKSKFVGLIVDMARDHRGHLNGAKFVLA